jgi:hypothetical protein
MMYIVPPKGFLLYIVVTNDPDLIATVFIVLGPSQSS